MDALRVADTDAPILHLVYQMWDDMIARVKFKVFQHEAKDIMTMQSDFFDVLHQILVERRQKSLTPLHYLAHSLNPKFYSSSWLGGGGQGVKRVAPNQDAEVAKNRSIGFERLFLIKSLRKVNIEFGKFCTSSDYYGELNVLEAKETCQPREWWGVHGFNAPLLQELANRLFCHPASSSCAESNWSTYSQIHTIKRNKLDSGRAEDLVYVHSNLRLLSRKRIEYKNGPSRYWDVEVEDEFSLEPGRGCLSLDDDEDILLNLNDDEIEGETQTQSHSEASASAKEKEQLIENVVTLD